MKAVIMIVEVEVVDEVVDDDMIEVESVENVTETRSENVEMFAVFVMASRLEATAPDLWRVAKRA